MDESFKERVDRWATAFAAITSIPVLGVIIKLVFDKITEKGAEALKKRVENILGLNLEDAKKDVSDEIIYSVAVASMTVDEQKEIDCFERKLRAEDKNKAEALILFIAKMIKTFEREMKETITPKKGESGPKVEQSYKSIAEGLLHAVNFLRALLRNTCATEDNTFESRVTFLEGKNVFSLIKKTTEPHPIFGKAKEYFRENNKDLAATMKSWRERSEELRSSRKK